MLKDIHKGLGLSRRYPLVNEENSRFMSFNSTHFEFLTLMQKLKRLCLKYFKQKTLVQLSSPENSDSHKLVMYVYLLCSLGKY